MDNFVSLLKNANAVVRRTGSMASLSGADSMVYLEYRKPNKDRHPLFKKLRK